MTEEETRKAKAAMPNGYYRLSSKDTLQDDDLWWVPISGEFEHVNRACLDESVGPDFVIRPLAVYNADGYEPFGLPTDAASRKGLPIATGVLDYFPLALAEVAKCSQKGNDQHNPGEPLHWDRSKSGDEADALIRHFIERGEMDTDGIRHSAKVAWRALAMLQKELEGKK